MTVVNGQMENPARAVPDAAAVTVVLVDQDDRPVTGFWTAGRVEIGTSARVPVGVDGTWSVDLVPNSSIQLAGGAGSTAYRVTESGAGWVDTWWMQVPTVGPVWSGSIRTTLVGAVSPSPLASLLVAGALTVGGVFTYQGVSLASPTGSQFQFLAADGVWRAPGGGPPTGSAGGDLFGSTYPNPQLAATSNVLSIVRANRLDQLAAAGGPLSLGGFKLTNGALATSATDFVVLSQLPATLPPSGSAGGDLGGVYPNPGVLALRGVSVGGGVPTSGDLLTAVSPTSAAWVAAGSSSGGSGLDPQTAKLGLCSQPVAAEVINNTDLGMSSDFVIGELQPQILSPVKSIGLVLGTAGSGPNGENKFALYEQGGTRVAVSVDMSSALSDPANNGKVVKGALTATFTPDPNKKYIAAVLGHMGTDPRIAGVFNGSGIHLPVFEGVNRSGIVLGSQSTLPASLDVVNALSAAAVYYLFTAPD